MVSNNGTYFQEGHNTLCYLMCQFFPWYRIRDLPGIPRLDLGQ